KGFVFFSGYESRKGRDLASNPRAALLFYWEPLGRQVRVEGMVERVGAAESDAYFATRPRGAQVAAVASRQGRILESPEERTQAFAELGRGSEGRYVPRPGHWGVFRLRADTYEFWQHHATRLHDRARYRRESGGWVRELVSP